MIINADFVRFKGMNPFTINGLSVSLLIVKIILNTICYTMAV